MRLRLPPSGGGSGVTVGNWGAIRKGIADADSAVDSGARIYSVDVVAAAGTVGLARLGSLKLLCPREKHSCGARKLV